MGKGRVSCFFYTRGYMHAFYSHFPALNGFWWTQKVSVKTFGDFSCSIMYRLECMPFMTNSVKELKCSLYCLYGSNVDIVFKCCISC